MMTSYGPNKGERSGLVVGVVGRAQASTAALVRESAAREMSRIVTCRGRSQDGRRMAAAPVRARRQRVPRCPDFGSPPKCRRRTVMRFHPTATLLIIGLASIAGAQGAVAKRPIRVGDMYRVKNVNDPQLSPDGKWVAYTVTTT